MALKYPRTYHLPTSPRLHNDDWRLPSLDCFRSRRVIVTEKADGECTTLTRAKTYPRSVDGRYHPSRDWLKAHHARKAHDIPAEWRISGEYLLARHSLHYTRADGNALRSYFYGFGVWDASNTLLDWDQALEIFALLDIEPVEVLYDGPFSDDLVARIAATINTSRQEGFVIRDAGALPYPSGAGGRGGICFDNALPSLHAAHTRKSWHFRPQHASIGVRQALSADQGHALFLRASRSIRVGISFRHPPQRFSPEGLGRKTSGVTIQAIP
jgi:hypothetical protein